MSFSLGVLFAVLVSLGQVTATAAAQKGIASQATGSQNFQTSLTLDPSLIGPNLANDGLAVPEAGQVASLTSTNNFINFCATTTLPNTNGQQIVGGSCNSVTMGQIPPKTNMPSAAFVFPSNFGTIAANAPFTIKMAINNLDTGAFVNPTTNYFGAPQQLGSSGNIIGHSHVVVQALPSLDSTVPLDPTVFAFFKGLNAPAVGGILTADVAGGLGAGVYRVCSINTDANHTPCLVPVAQHGSLDACAYFTATANGTSTTTTTTTSSQATSTTTTVNGQTTTTSAATTTTTTTAASTTTTTTTASTSTSTSAAGSSGGNLQKFTQALGGIAAPPVTKSGTTFVVTGQQGTFTSELSALQQSCRLQRTQCILAVKQKKQGVTFSISACHAQHRKCVALA